MVKYLKFNLHSLFVAIAYIMCLNKAKFDGEPTLSYSIGLPSLQKFVIVVHGNFYSYKAARTCSEPRLVEHRLSFAVEVTTASGNWKQPVPLKIIFSARFQWLLRFRMAGT